MNQKKPQIPTRVEVVTFEGDIHMPVPEQEQIAEAFKQRAWTSGPDLTELANEAGEVARMKWQEYGYFKVNVTNAQASLLSANPTQQVAALTIYLEEGPLYRLGDVRFRNVTVFPQEQLRPLFPMQPGDVFNTDKVRTGLNALRRLYGAQGYINFTSVPDTQIDDAARIISLVIDADEGKQFHVSSTDIVGLDQTLADALRGNWPIKPGDVYDTSLVEQFFKKNASLLPSGANSEDQVVRTIDEYPGTVALTLDFRPCQ